MLAPRIDDRDRDGKLFRFLAHVVFPNDIACGWIKGHHESTTRAAGVTGIQWVRVFVAATADDDLSIGRDGRGKERVGLVVIGEALGTRVDFP